MKHKLGIAMAMAFILVFGSVVYSYMPGASTGAESIGNFDGGAPRHTTKRTVRKTVRRTVRRRRHH